MPAVPDGSGEGFAEGQPGQKGSGNGNRGPDDDTPRSADAEAAESPPLRVTLTRPAPDLAPGKMSALTAVLGPHRGDDVIRLTVAGRLAAGLLYRAVTGPGGDRCRIVQPASFACPLTLPPGRQTTLRIWVTADALHPPSVAGQRLQVVASDPSLNTTVVWRRPLGLGPIEGPTAEPSSLARETMASPGPLLPLLALLLLALAAESARRQPTRQP